MKEIEAISRLDHANIVAYKGCWVETCDLNQERLKKIALKIEARD